MKKTNSLILLLSISLTVTQLSSCWRESEPIRVIRPVKVAVVQPLNNYQKEFIGTTTASYSSDLSFRVSGLIQQILISDGQAVRKGQPLARLDPSDFELQLSADQSAYQTALANLDRSRRLIEKQAISVQDYENSEARYAEAKASYHYAQNQLEYTQLLAPFTGSIERVFASDYQRVSAGEAVLRIINPDFLEVQFTLPQNDIELSTLKRGYYIKFENYPSELFSAEILQVVDASVNGAGIPVTLAITDSKFTPSHYNIKAGFPCKVVVKVESEYAEQNYTSVPLTAVFSPLNSSAEKCVWIYNAKDSTVQMQEIKTSGLLGNSSVIVSSGLESGEMVVTAGVYQITEGEKVVK